MRHFLDPGKRGSKFEYTPPRSLPKPIESKAPQPLPKPIPPVIPQQRLSKPKTPVITFAGRNVRQEVRAIGTYWKIPVLSHGLIQFGKEYWVQGLITRGGLQAEWKIFFVEGSGDIHEGIPFWSPFNFKSPTNKDAWDIFSLIPWDNSKPYPPPTQQPPTASLHRGSLEVIMSLEQEVTGLLSEYSLKRRNDTRCLPSLFLLWLHPFRVRPECEFIWF